MRKQTMVRAGFTLLEILVVVSILALIIGVIGATLSGGLRVWEVARRFGGREAEVLAGLDTMEKDLVNTFCFRSVPFQGGPESISFPALVFASQTTGNGQPLRPGRIKYVFNARERVLTRMESQWIPGNSEEGGRAEPLIRGVDSFELAYADNSRIRSDGEKTWLSTWESTTNLPVLVRIEISFSEEPGEKAVHLARTVLIPVAMTAVEHER